MDNYPGMTQVLTYSIPPLESIADPQQAVDLARRGNDEMAEIVQKNTDRFSAGVACLPVGNVEASLKEIDRAVKDLGLKGILLYTNINGRPLDDSTFVPIYETMARHDLPIWLHPHREENFPDYKTEDTSKYRIYGAFGWPYETEVAMTRLVLSGVLAKHPNLKFITHHCGGGIPFLDQRAASWFDSGDPELASLGLTRQPLEYLRMFYGDTALNGSTPALMCGFAFFGADHIVFGSDMPFGRQRGNQFIREAIHAIDRMSISESDRQKIYEGNARRLLHLDP